MYSIYVDVCMYAKSIEFLINSIQKTIRPFATDAESSMFLLVRLYRENE